MSQSNKSQVPVGVHIQWFTHIHTTVWDDNWQIATINNNTILYWPTWMG